MRTALADARLRFSAIFDADLEYGIAPGGRLPGSGSVGGRTEDAPAIGEAGRALTESLANVAIAAGPAGVEGQPVSMRPAMPAHRSAGVAGDVVPAVTVTTRRWRP